MFPYHILVTLDRNYLKVLSVMLYSLSQSDPEGVYTVYVVNNTLTEEDFASLSALLPRTELVNVQVPEDLLQNAPVSDRYPTEMYYRLFAARYLPQQLERILYLDPDLVVLHSLRSLYQIDFDGKLFAAASHIESRTFRELNRRRLHLSEHAKYLNSGVMMMNLALLRKESPKPSSTTSSHTKPPCCCPTRMCSTPCMPTAPSRSTRWSTIWAKNICG